MRRLQDPTDLIRNYLGGRLGLTLDFGLSLLILVAVAGFAASSYNPYKKSWSKSTFYEDNFAPAVLLACGLGYVEPPIVETSEPPDEWRRT